MKEKIRKILTVDRGVVYGDIPGLIADLKFLVNQEVEKRIAERMPSEAEKRAKARHLFVDGLNVLFACEEYDKWLRSRLTNPGVNDSQKTEGGGEPACPKCGSKFIMEHQYDDRYKICMSCKHNWKE